LLLLPFLGLATDVHAEAAPQTMSDHDYDVRQLADELHPPESGKESIVVLDNDDAKVVLFAFAAGGGLSEHIAPLPAIIQIVEGEAALTVGEESVAGKTGTWIRMAPRTPHSITARTPVVMVLTLLK
jgi:quercetin dioxygenase-like cupin family protein